MNDFPASNRFQKLTFIFSFASDHLIRIHSSYWPTNQKNRADTINKTTAIVCKLSVSIMRMLPRVSFQDGERFKQNLARYIHIYEEWETDKPNLFHRACNLFYVVEQKEPDYQQVIRLFLEAGANPNAIDADGNIPLHCLLPKNDFEYFLTNPWDNPNENDIPVIRSNFIESVRVLLDAGSHVDQSNRRRESVLELLKQNRKKQNSFIAYSSDSRLDDVINSILPLTCYCAQSIQKNNIPVENLPPTLQLFVRNH